jgi:hypothetical protein
MPWLSVSLVEIILRHTRKTFIDSTLIMQRTQMLSFLQIPMLRLPILLPILSFPSPRTFYHPTLVVSQGDQRKGEFVEVPKVGTVEQGVLFAAAAVVPQATRGGHAGSLSRRC